MPDIAPRLSPSIPAVYAVDAIRAGIRDGLDDKTLALMLDSHMAMKEMQDVLQDIYNYLYVKRSRLQRGSVGEVLLLRIPVLLDMVNYDVREKVGERILKL